MKNLLILILITVFANSIELSKKDIEVSGWMTNAYTQNNSKDMENILYILNSDVFFEKKTSYIIYAIFMSERFKQDSSYLTNKAFLNITGGPLEVLLFALKEANNKESLILYNKLLPTIKDKKFKKYIDSVKVFNLLDMDITEPAMTDSLWASFLASGKKEYVEKIIGILAKENKGVPNLLLIGSAKWSLLSNCQQHPKVLEICKSYKTENKNIRKELDEILKKLEEEKKITS